MKRALITFCIVWTVFTILLIACSPLLRLFAASRSRADLERIKAGEQPLHASKVGQLMSGYERARVALNRAQLFDDSLDNPFIWLRRG